VAPYLRPTRCHQHLHLPSLQAAGSVFELVQIVIVITYTNCLLKRHV